MISFQNITKIYPPRIQALKDINLDIEEGEFLSLVGPSGAGKTTLLKLLICAERPTKGKILVVGKDITRLHPWQVPYYRRKIGVVWQDFKLIPQKTVYENVAFALEVCGVSGSEIKRRVPEILNLVGLSNRMRSFPQELSGGEAQRVSIARALVHRPKILIADEPTGNIDPENAAHIIDLLLKINKELDTTVILATHNKDIVNRLEKRVVTLENGQIVRDQPIGKYML